jgi:hypothetical protein
VKVAIEDAKAMKPVGESITLLCEVDGNPKPVLSWSLREQTIIPSPGRVHISKGGQRYSNLLLCHEFGTFSHRLEIPRLRNEDTGEYFCIAQNEVGVSSASVDVEILGIPLKLYT